MRRIQKVNGEEREKKEKKRKEKESNKVKKKRSYNCIVNAGMLWVPEVMDVWINPVSGMLVCHRAEQSKELKKGRSGVIVTEHVSHKTSACDSQCAVTSSSQHNDTSAIEHRCTAVYMSCFSICVVRVTKDRQ